LARGAVAGFDGKLVPLVPLVLLADIDGRYCWLMLASEFGQCIWPVNFVDAVDHKTVINARYVRIACIFCLFAY
jgi:hypothetical protein